MTLLLLLSGPRVTLSGIVEIIEGNKGSFCAVIVDPPNILDRNITVILHTLKGTAERMLYMQMVLIFLQSNLRVLKVHSVCCLSG